MDWSQVKWEEIIPRLIAFAKVRVRSHRWQGRYGEVVPGGYEPEDFVYTAIIKTISGVRKWNPDKIDLTGRLIGGIRSEIWSRVNSGENKRTIRSDDIVQLVEMNGSVISPEDILQAKEHKEILLKEILHRNKTYYTICQEIVTNGNNDADEIANKIGCSVTTVYNARRFIKSTLQKIVSNGGS